MDLPAVIRSAVETSIAVSMQVVETVTTTEVEARLAVEERGRDPHPIM